MAVQIPLSQGQVTVVDDEDYGLVSRYKWVASWERRRFYAISRQGKKTIRMHRLIAQAPLGVLVDHRDRNGLNNTRQNLRLANPNQNSQNSDMRTSNSTGYKGVYFDKRRQLYAAGITVAYKQKHLGRYAEAVDAARAYDQAARELFGDFACLNFPGETTPPTPRKYLCPFCGHELHRNFYAPAIHVGHCNFCKK